MNCWHRFWFAIFFLFLKAIEWIESIHSFNRIKSARKTNTCDLLDKIILCIYFTFSFELNFGLSLFGGNFSVTINKQKKRNWPTYCWKCESSLWLVNWNLQNWFRILFSIICGGIIKCFRIKTKANNRIANEMIKHWTFWTKKFARFIKIWQSHIWTVKKVCAVHKIMLFVALVNDCRSLLSSQCNKSSAAQSVSVKFEFNADWKQIYGHRSCFVAQQQRKRWDLLDKI